MKTELQVPSDLKFMTVVENWLLDSLGAELQQEDIWPQLAMRLRLALVEAYSNVVRHAHKNKPDVPVILRLTLEQSAIALEIWDCGEGYDTTDYQAPQPEDRQEGGYGWMILNRLMDRVQYQVQASEGQNCLILETKLQVLQQM